MKKISITDLSHLLLKEYVNKDDIIVDATMGNGYDTLFLSSICKHVFSFDIQKEALVKTKEKLNNISNVTLVNDCHTNILNYIKDFNGVVFNLGYLPNGNKAITTKYETTLKAIDLILNHLETGFLLLVIYPGHEEGYQESIKINEYLNILPSSSYKILRLDLPYQKNNPPYIIMIQK